MKRVFASILAVLVAAFSGVAAAAVREPVEPLAVSSEAREDSSHVAMLDDGDAILWGDGLAALSFPEGRVPGQFYARLSTRADERIMQTYVRPADARAWFYTFEGRPMVPGAGRAALTLGIPWERDGPDAPAVSRVWIYEIDGDGGLADRTGEFRYSDRSQDPVAGWSANVRVLGSYLITDQPLAPQPTAASPAIPSTGSSAAAGLAAAGVIVSGVVAGAALCRKR